MAFVYGPFLTGLLIILTLGFVCRAVSLAWRNAVPVRDTITQPWMMTALLFSYPFNWIAIWAIGYFPWRYFPV